MNSIFAMLLFAAVTMTAVSFAWGMRGDLIGGEEGAILPGALLGFCIARFVLPKGFLFYCFYFIALGMTGMFIGGTEPYGEAFNNLYWGDGGVPKAPNMKKGIAALCVKGAPWFGICAAVLSVGFTALTGRYKAWQLVLLVVLLPIVRSLGTLLLNCPHNPKEGKFPRIYFSEESREEWGGLWFMLLDFLVFELACKDWLALVVTLCGMAGGAFGWVIAQLMCCATRVRMKNGKYFFGKLQEKKKIDNWKIMEFSFGALGSASIVFGFILCRHTAREYAHQILNGSADFGISDTAYAVMFAVWFALFILDNINHFIPEKAQWLKKPIEFLHRPMLCYIPMLFVLLGNMKVALFMAILVLFWQAPEELCFVQLKRRYRTAIPTVISYILLITLAVLLFGILKTVDIRLWFILICADYFICSCTADIAARYGLEGTPRNVFKLAASMGSFITVKLHYVFCIALTAFLLVLY